MEFFFGEEVQVDEQQVQIVGINEIIKTNEQKSILATRDIKSCVVVLLICEKEVYMLHIETLNENNYKLGLKTLKKMYENVNSDIKNKLVFYGLNTPETKYNDIAGYLGINDVYQAYIDNKNGSIAYNFTTNEFYGIDADNIFYVYKLGANNQKLDPLVAYYSSNNNTR